MQDKRRKEENLDEYFLYKNSQQREIEIRAIAWAEFENKSTELSSTISLFPPIAANTQSREKKANCAPL